MAKYYAGIGSRETPANVLRMMESLAARLSELDWTLRSGGAEGADSAFEKGAKGDSQIFLPWKAFNGSTSQLVVGDYPRMRKVAEQFHPNWEACSRGAKALHTRNVAQVLGLDNDPSAFVVCWTPRGEGGGGTGQAIRIAKHYGIPVFDLYSGIGALAQFIREYQPPPPPEPIDERQPVEESEIPY